MMKIRILLIAFCFLVSAITPVSLGQAKTARRTLEFYFIDTEGGAATLIVTPANESVLLDTGFPGFDGRDAKRVQLAMQQAGVTAIDHLITSHYHQDHYGAVAELARLVPIKHFYDHGKMDALAEDPQFAERYAAYQAAAKGQTTTIKPGDSIALKTASGTPSIKLVCVAANGEIKGVKKAGANPACSPAPTKEADTSENARSVGVYLSWGGFEFVNLADLTWKISQGLVCPANQLGEIDLSQVTHHGNNVNNDPRLLKSLQATVAVMINGPRKGGHPDTIKWMRELPELKALYQLHRNVQIAAEQNTAPELIANLEEQPDAGYMITVSVDAAKRAFTVTNGRTKESRSYPIKK